jgi:hypothetical protein
MKLDAEKVEAMVAKPLAGFLALLEKYGLDYGDFAREYNMEEIVLEFEKVEDDKAATKAQEKVLSAFKQVTDLFKEKTGLTLCVGNHPSSDIGSCYDDVDGFYYSLVFDEVFAVSEKAKELEKTIPYDMSFFVTYG